MNCLLKQLKTNADNNNLPVYGELKIKFATGNNMLCIMAETDGNCYVSGEPGITFKNATFSEDYTNPFQLISAMQYGWYIVAAQDGWVTFSNKYALAPCIGSGYIFGFQGVVDIGGGFDAIIIPSTTKEFLLNNTIMSLEVSQIADKLQSISGLKQINLRNTSSSRAIVGNIASLAIPGLENIDLGNNKNIVGELVSFGSITTITNIALYGSSVSGTIESFVAAQRTAGRTTGSVGGNSAGWGEVTFDGAKTHAKGVVSWTATTITMDGVTINA